MLLRLGREHRKTQRQTAEDVMVNNPATVAADSCCALPSAPFTRILVATDGSHVGHRAIELGAQLAGAFKAKLAVVHVVDTTGGFTPNFAWGPRTFEQEYQVKGRQLLELVTQKLQADLQVEQILRTGKPAVEIARVAAEWKADLLIAGGPSHHRLGRIFCGSVDETILDRISCALMIVGREEKRE